MELTDTTQIASADGATLDVRRLSSSDAEALQAFNAALSDESRRKFLPHLYDDDTVHRALERSEAGDDLTLGVFDGGRMIGYFFLWYFGERVPLLGIGMLDEFQHRGLGRKMMAILIDQARENGSEGIELTTMQDNDNAFALYQKVGFRYLKDVENVVGDGRIEIERALFYEIKPGAEPMAGPHQPPV